MQTYFVRKFTPAGDGEIREYIFAEMDYIDGVLTLEDNVTFQEIAGTVSFGHGHVTLTTRGYVEYEILAFMPAI